MLVKFIQQECGQPTYAPRCAQCEGEEDRAAEIVMHGYAENGADVVLCRQCALQLTRKLAEDLCEVIDGDRHR